MNNKTINYQAHKAASADLCHDLSICKRMFTKQSKLLKSFVNRIGFTTYETVEGATHTWSKVIETPEGIERMIDMCIWEQVDFTIKTNK